MANPPIVIGPFDNVPAPGSPIRSDWPQEISHYAVDNVAALATPNTLNGGFNALGMMRMESGSKNTTTDSNGNILIPFATPFAGLPVIICCNGDWLQAHACSQASTALHEWTANVRRLDDGGLVVNGVARVNWFAVGRR